eukprot:534940_1
MSVDVQNTETETSENKTDKSVTHTGFKMDWMKICECISHEMWPKLSSIIKSIIRENNIDNYQINENIKNIIDSLTTRTIEIEPIKYLQKLIKRAIDFASVTNSNNNFAHNIKKKRDNLQTLLNDVYSA